MKKYYSVIWYTEIDKNGNPLGDFEEKEFKTKQQALSFYNNHKKDADKFCWWVSSRDEDGFVMDDFVY